MKGRLQKPKHTEHSKVLSHIYRVQVRIAPLSGPVKAASAVRCPTNVLDVWQRKLMKRDLCVVQYCKTNAGTQHPSKIQSPKEPARCVCLSVSSCRSSATRIFFAVVAERKLFVMLRSSDSQRKHEHFLSSRIVLLSARGLGKHRFLIYLCCLPSR